MAGSIEDEIEKAEEEIDELIIEALGIYTEHHKSYRDYFSGVQNFFLYFSSARSS